MGAAGRTSCNGCGRASSCQHEPTARHIEVLEAGVVGAAVQVLRLEDDACMSEHVGSTQATRVVCQARGCCTHSVAVRVLASPSTSHHHSQPSHKPRPHHRSRK
jgi:hypothetical protein